MAMDMTPEEQRTCRRNLGCLRGNARQIKRRLDSSVGVAKKVGRIWVWRVNGIREDVVKLLESVEAEMKMME